MRTATFICGFAILLCAMQAVQADSSRPLGDYVAGLKHDPFPIDSSGAINSDGFVPYATSVITIVGPGLAIAILSIVVGIIYGLVRLCCCLCCSSSSDDDEEGSGGHKTYGFSKRMVPTGFYVFFMLWILAGCIIGWTSNGKFTNGVTSLSDSVVSIGDGAIDLSDKLLGGIKDIGDALPVALYDMVDQISGLPTIADKVVELGHEVNSTTADVAVIGDKVRNITAVNLTVLSDLEAELRNLNQKSAEIIGNVTSLTEEVATNLNDVYQETITTLDEKIADVKEGVDEIIKSSNDFVDSAKDMVGEVKGYISDGRGYDSQREKGLAAVLAAGFVACCVAIVGFFIKRPFPFHITAGFGFVFSFLFWASGSVHLLLGIVLSDVCPIADPVVRSYIPKDGQAAAAINGCLGDVSIFDSLNLTNAFNLSNVFDYRGTFDEFTGFVDEFNFTEIDGYLDGVNNLYTFNLTAAADNMTVADLGWDQKNVYDGLDNLNFQVQPFGDYFSVQNYTDIDLNKYPPGNDDHELRRINASYVALDGLVYANKTVYEELEKVKVQLIDVQSSIDVLVANIHGVQDGFHTLQDNITTLATVNVTNAIGIIERMIARVDAFFLLGDCSFLGRGYRGILDSLCSNMAPSVDMLMGSSFMIGMGVIAVIVLVEVLAVRVPHPGDDDVEFYDGKDKKGEYSYNDPKEGGPQAISMAVRTDDPAQQNNNNNTQYTY